jgi:hypothetical protein
MHEPEKLKRAIELRLVHESAAGASTWRSYFGLHGSLGEDVVLRHARIARLLHDETTSLQPATLVDDLRTLHGRRLAGATAGWRDC